ncbi:MAG: hypothetical protein HW416_445 [Chloroflexi bacterium]|nr:hypothetical protein [Chloroflexota bacterium]
MLGKLANRPFARVYEEDFLNTPTTSQDLLQQLDAADRLLDDWGGLITRQALDARFPRPANVVLSGAEYMIHHYGHAKEHVAHAELTLQIIRAKTAPAIGVLPQ